MSAMMLPERTLCHRVDWGVVLNGTKDGLMAGPALRAVGTKEHQNGPMVPRGGVMPKLQNGHNQRADLGELLPEPTNEPASNSPHGTVDRAVHCRRGPDLVQGFETRCGRFLVFCQFCMQEAQWAKRPRGWDDGSEAGAGSQGSDPATEEDVPGLLEDSESDCESGEDTEGEDQEPEEEELADTRVASGRVAGSRGGDAVVGRVAPCGWAWWVGTIAMLTLRMAPGAHAAGGVRR